MKRHGKAHGFTLMELLVVLTIAAILMAVAAPALQNLVTSSQLTALTDDFATALNLARSEAGRIGASVSVSAAGGGWGSGWSVNSSGTTLRQAAALPAGYRLTASDPYDDGTPVRFDATGRAVDGNGQPAVPGKFILCQGGGPPNGGAKLITVAASGRVRIAQSYNSAGWPIDDTSGTAINDCGGG
jgi:type IV fimbrial biogenesis protein FimT